MESGRVVLIKRPTLCAQLYLITPSHGLPADSITPKHRRSCRTKGHFIKMTLPHVDQLKIIP